jgi:hypothetical protein
MRLNEDGFWVDPQTYEQSGNENSLDRELPPASAEDEAAGNGPTTYHWKRTVRR